MSKVSVTIHKKTYDVDVNPGEDLFLMPVVEYLNRKFYEVEESTGIVDTQNLAVLTALNIADELLRLKNSKESVTGDIAQKAGVMARALDDALSL